MAMAQVTQVPEKGGFRRWMNNKVFLNTSFAWGVFIGIHLERYLVGLGKKGLLFFL